MQSDLLSFINQTISDTLVSSRTLISTCSWGLLVVGCVFVVCIVVDGWLCSRQEQEDAKRDRLHRVHQEQERRIQLEERVIVDAATNERKTIPHSAIDDVVEGELAAARRVVLFFALVRNRAARLASEQRRVPRRLHRAAEVRYEAILLVCEFVARPEEARVNVPCPTTSRPCLMLTHCVAPERVSENFDPRSIGVRVSLAPPGVHVLWEHELLLKTFEKALAHSQSRFGAGWQQDVADTKLWDGVDFSQFPRVSELGIDATEVQTGGIFGLQFAGEFPALRWLPTNVTQVAIRYQPQLVLPTVVDGNNQRVPVERLDLNLENFLPFLTQLIICECRGLGGALPDLTKLPPRLISLNLSSNDFSGSVDPLVAFANLPTMSYLYLHNNRLDFGDLDDYASRMPPRNESDGQSRGDVAPGAHRVFLEAQRQNRIVEDWLLFNEIQNVPFRFVFLFPQRE